MTIIIDGKAHAQTLKDAVACKVSYLKSLGIQPGLAVIVVGDDPASQIYVNAKCQQSEMEGIRSFKYHYAADISQADLIQHVYNLNADLKVHGILIQLPLPFHLDQLRVIQALDHKKDVDGLHPLNIGLLTSNQPYMIPCTPLGCLYLLKKVHSNLKGLNIVIIGKSLLVGRPLLQLLLNEHCTVTTAHKSTRDLSQLCVRADVIITATGKPGLIKKDWVRPGATVIDVGITRIIDEHGKTHLVGDCDYNNLLDHVAAITPVPGGVGPMTVACLLENTIKAVAHQHHIVL